MAAECGALPDYREGKMKTDDRQAQARALLLQQCGTQIGMAEFASDWIEADQENSREARLHDFHWDVTS